MKNALTLCVSVLTCTILFSACSVAEYSIKDFPDSPCFNKRLTELESDSLKTELETNEFLALKKMCEDHKNSVAEQNELRKVSANIGAILLLDIALLIIGGIALAAR